MARTAVRDPGHLGWTIRRTQGFFAASHPDAPALILACDEGDLDDQITEYEKWMRDPDVAHQPVSHTGDAPGPEDDRRPTGPVPARPQP